jgi:hypothetical protein
MTWMMAAFSVMFARGNASFRKASVVFVLSVHAKTIKSF